MGRLTDKWRELFRLNLRFAASSSVATLVDYVLYNILVHRIFSPVVSNILSSSVGMVINFLLQKRFVFSLERKLYTTLTISFVSSIIGIGISTGIIYTLSQIFFFNQHQYLTKALATGVVFFYNFFMKRFAFEKKMI